jgi:hypothetical protein
MPVVWGCHKDAIWHSGIIGNLMPEIGVQVLIRIPDHNAQKFPNLIVDPKSSVIKRSSVNF